MFLTHSRSTLHTADGITILDLHEETHFQTGYAYGALLAAAGHPAVSLLRNRLVSLILFLAERLLRRRFRSITVPEEYLNELRGMAAAAAIPFTSLYFINFCFDILKSLGFHCSTFTFVNRDGVLAGRNTDLYPLLARLAIKFAPPAIVTVRIPGRRAFSHATLPFFLGVINGFNEESIAVCTHQIISVKENAPGKRLASPLLARMILEQAGTGADAAVVIRDQPIVRSLNVMVISGSEQTSTVYELNPLAVNIIPQEGQFSCCATHFTGKDTACLHHGPIEASRVRLASLSGMLQNRGELSVPVATGILQDTRNGMQNDYSGYSMTNNGTYQSMVMDLAERVFYLSTGNSIPVSLSGRYARISVLDQPQCIMVPTIKVPVTHECHPSHCCIVALNGSASMPHCARVQSPAAVPRSPLAEPLQGAHN